MLSKTKRQNAPTAREGSHLTMSGGRRSISEILERRRRRQKRRSHTRAPDFLHGDCPLGTIYETFGAAWVEQTVFVQRVVGPGGSPIGWTVASYDEEFLTIEHGVAGEIDDPDAWLREKVAGCKRVFALGVDCSVDKKAFAPTVDVTRVSTSRQRILRLENRHLHVTRDRDFDYGDGMAGETRERLLESRLDLMSLICLCARLVVPSQ